MKEPVKVYMAVVAHTNEGFPEASVEPYLTMEDAYAALAQAIRFDLGDEVEKLGDIGGDENLVRWANEKTRSQMGGQMYEVQAVYLPETKTAS